MRPRPPVTSDLTSKGKTGARSLSPSSGALIAFTRPFASKRTDTRHSVQFAHCLVNEPAAGAATLAHAWDATTRSAATVPVQQALTSAQVVAKTHLERRAVPRLKPVDACVHGALASPTPYVRNTAHVYSEAMKDIQSSPA